MKQEAHAFAFIAGLCAGVFNLLCGLNALGNVLFALEYVDIPAGLILAAAALITITVVNLVGGSVCRKHRTVGGIMMIVSAVLLLIAGAVCLYVPLKMPEVFFSAFGADFAVEVRRAVLGAGMLLVFSESISITAGVVSLIVKPKPEIAA